MKQLNKLQINPEKKLSNRDLLMLRGGYENCCSCYDRYSNPKGYMIGATASNCDELCRDAYLGGRGDWEC